MGSVVGHTSPRVVESNRGILCKMPGIILSIQKVLVKCWVWRWPLMAWSWSEPLTSRSYCTYKRFCGKSQSQLRRKMLINTAGRKNLSYHRLRPEMGLLSASRAAFESLPGLSGKRICSINEARTLSEFPGQVCHMETSFSLLHPPLFGLQGSGWGHGVDAC
jgi:hypothetical protein